MRLINECEICETTVVVDENITRCTKKKKTIDAKKDSFYRVNEDMMFLLDNLLSSERGHPRIYANYCCDFYSV